MPRFLIIHIAVFLNVNIKLLFNSVSAQDISVFDNISEILPRLPDSENGPAPVATEHFLCGYRYADGPRSLMFSLEELVGIRCCYLETSREELDIAILSCGMHMSKITSHGRYSEEDAENRLLSPWTANMPRHIQAYARHWTGQTKRFDQAL